MVRIGHLRFACHAKLSAFYNKFIRTPYADDGIDQFYKTIADIADMVQKLSDSLKITTTD